MKYVVSALQAAKPMLEISVSDLDRDGFLLNTPDGTYYLPDGLEGRRDHSPEIISQRLQRLGQVTRERNCGWTRWIRFSARISL